MWGNAFSDLAKKAQDLQEQAKEQASHLSTPTFFNLDAMQEHGEDEASKGLFATPQPSDHAAKQSHTTTEQQTVNQAPFALFDQVKPSTENTQSDSFTSGWNSHYFSESEQQETPSHNNVAATAKRASPTMNKVPQQHSVAAPQTSLNNVPSTDSADAGGWDDDDGFLGIESDDVDELAANGEIPLEATKQSSPTHSSADADFRLDTATIVEATTVEAATADEEEMATEEAYAFTSHTESLTGGGDENDFALQQSSESSLLDTAMSSPIGVNKVIQEPVVDTELSRKDNGASSSLDTAENSDTLLLPVNEIEAQELSVKASEEELVEKEHGAKVNVENHVENDAAASDVDEMNSFNHITNSHEMSIREEDKPTTPVQEECPTRVVASVETQADVGKHDVATPSHAATTGHFEIGLAETHESSTADDTHSVPDDKVMDQPAFEVAGNHDVEDKATNQNVASASDEISSEQHPVSTESSNASESSPTSAAKSIAGAIGTNSPAGDNGETKFGSTLVAVDVKDSESVVKDVTVATPPIAPSSQHDYELEMQRLRQGHQAEVASLVERHENRMQEALASFNHDHCVSQRQEMEQRFLNQIRGKEEQLQELMRENEGFQLKIDVLKREVTGTQALLEQRDSTMGSANASYSKNVELLEQRIQEMNSAASLAKAEAQQVKEALKSTKSELDASNEAYATLKSRVKVVATELKERRVECRSLAMSVAELKQTNEQLETQVDNLQSQISVRDKSQMEKEKDLKQSRERIEMLELELHKKESELKNRDSVGEKALSTYKKKAQNALAVANARAAAANQAKEEAEAEAATARSMSEEAVERARETETAGKKALVEAKEYVREMETEKLGLEKRLSEATAALESTKAESESLRNSLEATRMAEEKLTEDVKVITHEREEERGRNRELQRQLDENQRRLELLYEEVETLREDLRQATSVAASSSGDNAEKESRSTVRTHPTWSSDEVRDRSDADGTIEMLEGELRHANRAIKELKEALKNAIAEQGSNGYGHHTEAPSPSRQHAVGPRAGHASGPAGNQTTPLFFALEKQAELNTARDEITRLANLLGDAESSKMEAYEAVDEMRRRMEEAEARLNRQEKFEGTTKPTTSSNHDAGSNANLEYLKNIMLSYLNAGSLAEKKALVPVIAAVLCLTPEEQATAMKNLDESSGIEGVGKALFESLGGSIRR